MDDSPLPAANSIQWSPPLLLLARFLPHFF